MTVLASCTLERRARISIRPNHELGAVLASLRARVLACQQSDEGFHRLAGIVYQHRGPGRSHGRGRSGRAGGDPRDKAGDGVARRDGPADHAGLQQDLDPPVGRLGDTVGGGHRRVGLATALEPHAFRGHAPGQKRVADRFGAVQREVEVIVLRPAPVRVSDQDQPCLGCAGRRRDDPVHGRQTLIIQVMAVEGEENDRDGHPRRQSRGGFGLGFGRPLCLGFRFESGVYLVHRTVKAVPARGDMIELVVLFLLLDPAVEIALRPGRRGRGGFARIGFERRHQARTRGPELGDRIARQSPVLQPFRLDRLAGRRVEALAGEMRRVRPVVHLVGLEQREIAVCLGKRPGELGAHGLDAAHRLDIPAEAARKQHEHAEQGKALDGRPHRGERPAGPQNPSLPMLSFARRHGGDDLVPWRLCATPHLGGASRRRSGHRIAPPA